MDAEDKNDPVHCALRETEEELGIDRKVQIEIILENIFKNHISFST